VLNEHGIKIAPSTFYEARSRPPPKRALRDAEIVALIEAERERQKFVRRFGARKMRLHLRGRGHDVARCTIERLYTEQGWVGALRMKKVRTTIPDESADRPTDLVDRQFFATRPNQLWVADF
jgi:putative transposase